MRVLTWNINSVRLRLPLLIQLIKSEKPDVFCLQETKTQDAFFPVDDLQSLGYTHHHFTGIKSYNGVAIFSKKPLDQIKIHKRCGALDARHISARVDGRFELHNVYIPAGGYEPDPIKNPKFQHKLDFVAELTKWFSKNRAPQDPMMIAGDLNIAPLENDVWDHEKMKKVVSHTPVEREAFARLYESVGWHDAVRHFVPENKKLFTWWSYRAPDWQETDRGRRLDHVWVTKPLAQTLQKQKVLRAARGWQQPSDHVPVIVDLAV